MLHTPLFCIQFNRLLGHTIFLWLSISHRILYPPLYCDYLFGGIKYIDCAIAMTFPKIKNKKKTTNISHAWRNDRPNATRKFDVYVVCWVRWKAIVQFAALMGWPLWRWDRAFCCVCFVMFYCVCLLFIVRYIFNQARRYTYTYIYIGYSPTSNM